jgi:hypothetical protein
MSGKGIYWVHVDFGGDHQIRRCFEQPDVEWQGPFGTFTAARQCILKAGASEIAEIRSNLAQWRSVRKADVLNPGRAE